MLHGQLKQRHCRPREDELKKRKTPQLMRRKGTEEMPKGAEGTNQHEMDSFPNQKYRNGRKPKPPFDT